MSVREKIREMQERSEKRSEQASARYLKGVRALAEGVKQRKLLGEDSENLLPEVHMRATYFFILDNYYRKSTVHVPSEMTNKSKAMWRRVVSTQGRSTKEPEEFLTAQFAYFDKQFGCVPKLYQLTTEAAIERADTFKNGKSLPVSGGIEYKLDKADKFRLAEKTLLDVQRAQGLSREEVYRELVIPGHLFIDPDFLKIDPVYKLIK